MGDVLTGLLLAGGSASRFGSNKLLARLPGDERVGLQAAQRIADAVDSLIVVTRAGDDTTRECFSQAGFDVVECADADRGMGHSLRCGVRRSMQARAWMVALGDMPHVETATVKRVIRRFDETDAIIVPNYRQRSGHPVLFPARYRSDLLELSGDEGARPILRFCAAEIKWIETDDPGVLFDIDEPSDLTRMDDLNAG